MRGNSMQLAWGVAGVLAAILVADLAVLHRRPTPDLLWVEASREYPRLCRQTYRLALDRIRQSLGAEKRDWAVVMDVDDTCLSTLAYHRARRQCPVSFFRSRWSSWCQQAAAPGIAGAAEFAREVKALGGRVVLITNRKEELRPATEKNLRQAGMEYDALLMAGESTTKEGWRQKLQAGKAVPGWGPLEIAACVGDRVGDCSAALSDPEHEREWGSRFFLLPNPMLGAGK